MSSRKLQKIFYFSTDEKKEYIESRLNNLSRISNHSTSYLIENMLLAGLLPRNEEAKNLLLYKMQGDHAVRDTLEAIFSSNAAGYLYYAKYNNMEKVLDFTIKYCAINIFDNEDMLCSNYLLVQFREIVERINSFTEASVDLEMKQSYKTFAIEAKYMLAELQEDKKCVDIFKHFCMVRDCWDMLSNWSTTYRYLAELVRLNNAGWDESIYAREELHRIISEISNDWNGVYRDEITYVDDETVLPKLLRFNIIDSNHFNNGKDVMVNDVPMGVIYSISAAKDELIWDVIENKQAVKFSLKKKEIFLGILENMRIYKDTHGYKRLIITSYNDGIASFFSEKTLFNCGFKKVIESASGLYYLE